MSAAECPVSNQYGENQFHTDPAGAHMAALFFQNAICGVPDGRLSRTANGLAYFLLFFYSVSEQ
jgi:hypothetical protein